MARKFGVSLNENDPEEGDWIAGIDESGMMPAHVLKAALRLYFGTSRNEQERTTTGDVVDAINAGFAMLARKLDNVIVEPRQRPQDVERRDPDDEPSDDDLELDDTFIADLRRVASGRPGMRMES